MSSQLEQALRWADNVEWRASILCEALHDLLGPFDGRDPETDGPIDLETNGACIRKAQAVLAEVE